MPRAVSSAGAVRVVAFGNDDSVPAGGVQVVEEGCSVEGAPAWLVQDVLCFANLLELAGQE
jgi:hypothetical protein